MNGGPASQTLHVQGTAVLVEGEGPRVALFVHGWPDTLQLWDTTAAALVQAGWRCARFTLPGFDRSRDGASAPTLADLVQLLRAVGEAVSPAEPLTLVLHDWGCVFGYEFAMRHPERVARIVAVDVGDHNAGAFARSLTPTARRQLFAYQIWLAAAWKIGGRLGDLLTQRMARALRAPAHPSTIGVGMNYPYAMRWFGSRGGLKGAAKVAPACPLLYLYGERKPFMFHSPQWLAWVAARPGSAVRAFPTGHWVMAQRPGEFNACVLDWLGTAPDAPT